MLKKYYRSLIVVISVLTLTGGVSIGADANTAWTDRIGGSDRIETAIEISRQMYPDVAEFNDLTGPNPFGPNYVIIARSDLFPDALAGAGLVTDVAVITLPGGEPVEEELPISNPVLLTGSNALDDRVKDEIKRLIDLGRGQQGQNPGLSGAKNTNEVDTQVYILGDTGAISDEVIDDLEKISGIRKENITRIGGTDRYETAVMIDDEMAPGSAYGHEENSKHILIATGSNFPDALSAAGYAASQQAPILLVKKDEIPDQTLKALDGGDADHITIVGGTGVVSNNVRSDLGSYADDLDRVGGNDRYETAIAFAQDVWGVDNNVSENQRFVFARGDDFPDALAGAGLIANESRGIGGVVNATSPLDPEVIPTLLTPPGSLNTHTEEYLNDIFEDNGLSAGVQSVILGETGAIDLGTEEDIAIALSDGDFKPTIKKPEIDDSEVIINDNSSPTCTEDVARADCNESITIGVAVKDIRNEDLSIGDVFIDTTVLGKDDSTTYIDDFELDLVNCTGDDCAFLGTIPVETDDDNDNEFHTDVTLQITATNQAGSDTAESEMFDIVN